VATNRKLRGNRNAIQAELYYNAENRLCLDENRGIERGHQKPADYAASYENFARDCEAEIHPLFHANRGQSLDAERSGADYKKQGA
jgi:hypothetical protein